VIAADEQIGNYIALFAEFQKRAPGHNLPWLRELRENAFARFCEVGFPTTHDEDWRFTNVSPISRMEFALPSGKLQPSQDAIQPFSFPGAACQLVFIDGRFSRERSMLGSLPQGVLVSSLGEQLARNPDVLEKHFGRYLNVQRDAFSALNTALAEDGAWIFIPRGTVVKEPISLLFVTTQSDQSVMTHPRNLIVAERETQATIVEDYVSLASSHVGAALQSRLPAERDDLVPAFCNTATELIAGDNAAISHYMIEREHQQTFNISTLRLQQGRSANVSSHSLLFGGGLVRNNVHPVLAGEGAECLINGLFIGNGKQHLDNYMLVEHASPHCASRQFYNGILDDQAHGVFHGRIIVHKDAQKTDAKQTNRNLLLSDDARIDTKPQLEIYADDVKCTHGATIGQIEENALFYLRSRGIDEVSARKLLLMAFAGECLERMDEGAARDFAEQLIHAHLLTIANSTRNLAKLTTEDFSRKWEEIG
jgi:Fe-S cluster assembly protein SufD